MQHHTSSSAAAAAAALTWSPLCCSSTEGPVELLLELLFAALVMAAASLQLAVSEPLPLQLASRVLLPDASLWLLLLLLLLLPAVASLQLSHCRCCRCCFFLLLSLQLEQY